MTPRKPGSLIVAELEADLDRYALWLVKADEGGRRRRRKARRSETARLYRERMGHVLRRAQRINPTVGEVREAFLAWMREPTKYGKPAADSTVRASYHALLAWAQWKGLDLGADALDAFDVPSNPQNGRGEEAVIAPEAATLFLARLAEEGDRRNYAICRLLLYAGPRRRVIAYAKVRHFDYAGRALTIDADASKGGRPGALVMDPVTADAIADYLDTRWDAGTNPDAPLFHSYMTGDHLHPDSVTDLVAKLTRRLLGERRTPHELRHTFITYAANGVLGEPMPIAQLQRQVQHPRATTTLRYVHPAGDPKDAYDRAMGVASSASAQASSRLRQR